jgi:peptide/nickel transport system substrate-binding protein
VSSPRPDLARGGRPGARASSGADVGGRRGRLRAGLVAALLGLAPGAGCLERGAGSDAGAASVETPRGLVLGVVGEPDVLDPVFAQSAVARELLGALSRDLVVFDDAWRLVPDLAAELPRVETTSTGRARVRWTLRPGLRWSDGHPLGAADVAFGQRVEADPALGAAGQAFAARVRAMTIVDAGTVVAEWPSPAPDVVAPRVHAVLPAHAYPAPVEGRPFVGMGRAPVSSGPYRLAEWVPGERIVLRPNPHWTGPGPRLPELVWRIFTGEDALEAALRSGGIDAIGEAAGLALDRAARLAEDPAVSARHRVQFTAGGVWLHLELRLDHPLLSRAAVRRALDAAIDRRVLAELAYDGRAEPAFGAFPLRHPAASTATRAVDLDGARAALAAVTTAAERGLPIRLGLASGSRASERAGAYLADRFTALGLKLELEPLPFRVLMARLRAGEGPPMALHAWRAGPDWDARAVLHSGGALNYSGVRDAEIDAAYARAETSADAATWTAALRRVEARYRSLLPSLPLVFRQSVSVRPVGLEGWRPTGASTPVTWNVEAWGWSARPMDVAGPNSVE